ncbi:hypothetical protein QCD71_19615 [Sphingomonas sp. PsM26]|nr:hypothetical protein [Sphingomonas sp. PsM26]
MVPLNLSAALVSEHGNLGLGLDTLSNDGQPETTSKPDHGLHDCACLPVVGHVADKRLINLDLVEREEAEVAE